MPTKKNSNHTTTTRAVRAGICSDTHHGAVVPALHLSTNFSFAGFDKKRKYDYTRSGNPTRDLLAEALAELEEGAGAVVTSSGMSAVALALQLAPAGGKVLAAHDAYGGTYRLLKALAARNQIQLELADLTSPDAEQTIARCKPDLLWVETPSNPLLRITDLRKVCEAGHRVGALVVADNTFLSPALQRPLTLGADLVVHSTTKYLNGHSDVVGGAVVASDPANVEKLTWWANCLGLTGAPFDSYLTLRGVRTLFARIRVHEANAHAVASALVDHPAVLAVHYPGLSTHPGHAIAAGQQEGFGGMVSFTLSGGLEAASAVAVNLEHFTLAESLGGVESLIAHPATMTHSSMDPEARRVAGITDGMLRLSVGIEDVRDLVGDLTRALDALPKAASRSRSKRVLARSGSAS
jgi:cystathionine gamma-synthase